MLWLTLLVFLPLVFGLIVLIVPKQNVKGIPAVALIGTFAAFVVSLLIAAQYHPGPIGDFQLIEKFSWIPSLHANYFLGVDGISLMMVLMTTAIWPFVVGVSFKEITTRSREFYFWVLLMETAVLGVFLSLNLLLFYIFWEAMLIPVYFIIGVWGGPQKIYATVKFFLYTMFGSLVMLVSIMALYFLSSPNPVLRTLDFPQLLHLVGSGAMAFHGATELLLFIGFFLAFGIKAPVWPFHSWVPDSYSQAPTGGTIILVALKMGLYGFIRFCLPLFPHAVAICAPFIIVLSVIGIIYAALVAAMQTDLKRLVAYSSISHIGVMMLAIFTLTSIGITGAVIQMISHTITTGALFIILGGLYMRRKSYAIKDFGGLMAVMPAFTAVFLIAILSSVSLPSTSGFTGEFLMLIGSFQTHPWATSIATTVAIWSVVYMLWMFQRVVYGPITNEGNRSFSDWTTGERWTLAPLVLIIFFIGIYPNPLLKLLNPSVKTVVTQADLGYTDPLPPPATAITASLPARMSKVKL